MSLNWQWNEKIGELEIAQEINGEMKDFTISLYTGNATLIMLHECDKRWTMYNFFADKKHMMNCLNNGDWCYRDWRKFRFWKKPTPDQWKLIEFVVKHDIAVEFVKDPR